MILTHLLFTVSASSLFNFYFKNKTLQTPDVRSLTRLIRFTFKFVKRCLHNVMVIWNLLVWPYVICSVNSDWQTLCSRWYILHNITISWARIRSVCWSHFRLRQRSVRFHEYHRLLRFSQQSSRELRMENHRRRCQRRQASRRHSHLDNDFDLRHRNGVGIEGDQRIPYSLDY